MIYRHASENVRSDCDHLSKSEAKAMLGLWLLKSLSRIYPETLWIIVYRHEDDFIEKLLLSLKYI
jgi:hypothetical protein